MAAEKDLENFLADRSWQRRDAANGQEEVVQQSRLYP